MYDLLVSMFSDPKLVFLVYAMLGNLALGIIASLRTGDFRLTRVADWLVNRLIPLWAGYAVAALLATAREDFLIIREAAYYTLAGVMVGYILANLKDAGIPVPDVLGAKADDD